jgi:hypothetical protein
LNGGTFMYFVFVIKLLSFLLHVCFIVESLRLPQDKRFRMVLQIVVFTN